MKKISLIAIASLLFLSVVSAQNQTRVEVYYFWQEGCGACAYIKPYLEKFQEKYDLSVQAFELRFNQSNRELFQEIADKYGITPSHTPTIFIGDKVIVGAYPELLEAAILDCLNTTCVSPKDYANNNRALSSFTSGRGGGGDVTLLAVISAALADSINPCAFSVLIFLLLYLVNISNKKRVLKIGMIYISVVFLVYFASGLGLFAFIRDFLNNPNIALIISNSAAVIAVIAGLINIKDFFWYGKGISLRIPESKKELIKRLVRKASIPSAIVLGFVVSLVELPCTGIVYFNIINLLVNQSTLLQAITYLLLYNFIFVLPLFLILSLFYFGLSLSALESWLARNRKWLRLITGLFMIFLGVLILSGVLR